MGFVRSRPITWSADTDSNSTRTTSLSRSFTKDPLFSVKLDVTCKFILTSDCQLCPSSSQWLHVQSSITIISTQQWWDSPRLGSPAVTQNNYITSELNWCGYTRIQVWQGQEGKNCAKSALSDGKIEITPHKNRTGSTVFWSQSTSSSTWISR